MVFDYVECHLPTAYRPLDIAHDRKLGFIQHKFVAGLHGQLPEGDKRVGCHIGPITGQLADRIIGLHKQSIPAFHTGIIEGIGHMPLVQYAGPYRLQAVEERIFSR